MQLKPLDVKTDRRGDLIEAFKLPHDGQITYVIAESGEIRGNHYHLRKTEHFLIIDGEAEIKVRDRTTGNIMSVVVSGHNPMDVIIAPNHTHALSPWGDGCIYLLWSDEQYNKDDPDTYPEEI